MLHAFMNITKIPLRVNASTFLYSLDIMGFLGDTKEFQQLLFFENITKIFVLGGNMESSMVKWHSNGLLRRRWDIIGGTLQADTRKCVLLRRLSSFHQDPHILIISNRASLELIYHLKHTRLLKVSYKKLISVHSPTYFLREECR